MNIVSAPAGSAALDFEVEITFLLTGLGLCDDPQMPTRVEATWMMETTSAGITSACPPSSLDWVAVCNCFITRDINYCPECGKAVIEGQVSRENVLAKQVLLVAHGPHGPHGPHSW